MANPLFSQYSYRIRDDTYGESTDNGWQAAVDTPLTGGVLDTTYRIRFVPWNNNGRNSVNVRWRLEYRHVEGANTWEVVTGSSTFVRSQATTHLTEDGNCTDLSAAMNNPAGDWFGTNLGQDDTDGTTGDVTAFNKNDYIHVEYAFQIRSADVTAGDQVDFRIVETDGDYTVDTYPATPCSITTSSSSPQSLTAPLVVGGATTVAPSLSAGPASITAPIVVGGATTVTPILYPGEIALTAPLTSGGETTVTPSMEVGAVALDAPIVSGAASVVAPSLSAGPASITAPIVVGGATTVTPTMSAPVGAQSLTAPIVVGGATIVTPTLSVGAVALTAPIVVGGATTVTPVAFTQPIHWRIEEGTGATTITDESNALDLNAVGTAKWVSGKSDLGTWAIEVDDSTDGAYEAASGSDRQLMPSKAVTLLVWFQPKSTTQDEAMLAGKQVGAAAYSYAIHYDAATLTVRASLLSNLFDYKSTPLSSVLTVDKWYCAVMRWAPGEIVSLRLYDEDGELIEQNNSAAVSGSSIAHTESDTYPFRLGKTNSISTNSYIDDVQLYHRKLSTDEVNALIEQHIHANIAVGGATTVAPSMTVGAVALTAPIIVGGATTVTPTMDAGAGPQSLTAPIVVAGATTVTPTLSVGAIALTAPIVVGGATTVAPTLSVGAVALTAPIVVGGATTVTPSMSGGAASITAPLVSAGATTVTPSMETGLILTAPIVVAGATVVTPTLSPGAASLAAPIVVGGATVVTPTLAVGAISLDAPLVSGAATVVTPTMAAGLVLTAPIVEAGATTVAPSLTGGAASLDAPVVSGAATVVTPTMSAPAPGQSLTAPIVSGGAAVVTPTLTVGAQTISGPIVEAGATTVAPSMTAGAVALIAPIVVAGATTVTPTMEAPGVDQSITAPIVEARAEVVQPWMLLSTEIVYMEFEALDECAADFTAIHEPSDFVALDETLTDFSALLEPSEFEALDECISDFSALEEDE